MEVVFNLLGPVYPCSRPILCYTTPSLLKKWLGEAVSNIHHRPYVASVEDEKGITDAYIESFEGKVQSQ